jgi:hypothetical protein
MAVAACRQTRRPRGAVGHGAELLAQVAGPVVLGGQTDGAALPGQFPNDQRAGPVRLPLAVP